MTKEETGFGKWEERRPGCPHELDSGPEKRRGQSGKTGFGRRKRAGREFVQLRVEIQEKGGKMAPSGSTKK